jgi:AcrR family transcriptional regulator
MVTDLDQQDSLGGEPSDPATGPAGAPRRRADAQRNIAAILDAGLTCFSHNPEASVAEIARTAGLGRVTVYSHFPSRRELVDAVLAHALAKANALDTVAIDDGPTSDALARLIRSSWRILDQHRGALAAAQRHLDAARIRQHHDQSMARVERLIARGQEEGTFRTDLPRSWLVSTFYRLMHGAAEEVDAGRLDPDQAADVLAASILGVLANQPG